MSDVNGATDGDGDHRIGDSERDAAKQALIAHREAGRLDPEEYEERQVQVSRARTWAEIRPLFDDLPQPHPTGMPPAAAVRGWAQPGATTPAVALPPGEAAGLLGGVVPERYRSTVMALTPFAALLLFFLTPGPGWLWFLAIPIMGVLLYGAEGDDARRRQQRLARDERRLDRDRRRDG